MLEMEESAVTDQRDAEDLPLFTLLTEDFETHERKLTSPGFWALAVHRVGSRIRAADEEGDSQSPLGVVHKVLATTVDWVWGIRVPLSTRVGRRVHIWHFGSMLLNARSIGNDVHIRHDTTFGPLRSAKEPPPDSLPVIEDGADIGSGACIMGGLTVGRGAKVGANTVVLESVPAGVTVFGVPARMLRMPTP